MGDDLSVVVSPDVVSAFDVDRADGGGSSLLSMMSGLSGDQRTCFDERRLTLPSSNATSYERNGRTRVI